MPVLGNYLAVILIWSTTPLAIKLSNGSLSAYAAVLSRMLLAFLLTAVVIAMIKHVAGLKRKHWRLYWVASLGLFPNMLLVYMAANYIPSGLISVLFAMVPIISGVLGAVVLKEPFFVARKILALALAITGLLVVFASQWSLGKDAFIGIGLMLIANLVFSISQVGTRYLQKETHIDALEQTFGSLTFALPGFFLTWWLMDGGMPSEVSMQSLWAVIYLAVVGSLLGFVAYFVILRQLSLALVSVIPLITPVLALWLGAAVLSEVITTQLMVGSALIILALAAYDEAFSNVIRKRSFNLSVKL
ncbi:DMT family transporter [Endozoicomonas arenosclerae]|uniref:DMT family transporter n=1 Tax=Endozoicomonas arenosclerae TaxID=1633495 RepID=UPI0007802549|nr:DMT family transporter [Endozoicomonas arenosclerae]